MKDQKDKFKFVNPIDKEDDFLLDEEEDAVIETHVEPALTEEEKRKLEKKKRTKKYILTAIILFFFQITLIGFALLWQWEISLMAIGDAFWFAFAIQFFVAWIMFAYNHNTFSSLIHGTKTFFLMITGKKPKEDFYEYMKRIEQDPIPRYYYIACFISAFILLIPSIIFLVILW